MDKIPPMEVTPVVPIAQQQPIAPPPKKITYKLIVVIVVGMLVILAASVLIWRMLFNQVNEISNEENVVAEVVEKPVDNLTLAKAILDFLWTQRTVLGLYASGSVCKNKNDLATCVPKDDSWRWSLPVMWARFKYYEATLDLEELERLQTDLDNMIVNVLNANDRYLQTSEFNCAFMREISNSTLISNEYQNKAAQICFLAEYESQALVGSNINSISIVDDFTELIKKLGDSSASANVEASVNFLSVADIYAGLDQIDKLNFSQLDSYTTVEDLTVEVNLLVDYAIRTYLNQFQQFSSLEQCLFQQDVKQYLSYAPDLNIDFPTDFYQPVQDFPLEIDQVLNCNFAHYLNRSSGMSNLKPIITYYLRNNDVIFMKDDSLSTSANALAAGFLLI